MEHDLTTEDILTFQQACSLFPATGDGTPAHVSRLYRYTKRGCRGVVLESLQCGATRCTTRQAIARFFRRQSAAVGIIPQSRNTVDHEAAIASGERLASLTNRDVSS